VQKCPEITLTRQLRNDKLADNVNVNPKSFWKYVNSHLGSKFSIGDLFLPGDIVAQSDKEKADAFNEFFASVFTSEDTSSLPDFHVDSTLPILSSVSIAPDNVYVKLRNLDPNKSAGPDNWPTKVLKDMAEKLCLPLTILFTKLLHYLMPGKEVT